MLNFNESGHPVFLGSSASKRGDFKSKGKGKLSIHFCGDENTAEFAQSSPSISSVSTEQKRTQSLWLVQNVQGNLLLRTIQKTL